MYFNPLEVFMPVALALRGLGIAKGICDLAAHSFRVADDTVLIFVSGLIIAMLACRLDRPVPGRHVTGLKRPRNGALRATMYRICRGPALPAQRPA
jgi:hypothetical protein